MESETFLSLFRSAKSRNAIYRVNGRVTAQPTESGGDCFSRFLCLLLVCAVSVLYILCLWWLELSSQWKSTHWVQGFVTSCCCLVFDSPTTGRRFPRLQKSFAHISAMDTDRNMLSTAAAEPKLISAYDLARLAGQRFAQRQHFRLNCTANVSTAWMARASECILNSGTETSSG